MWIVSIYNFYYIMFFGPRVHCRSLKPWETQWIRRALCLLCCCECSLGVHYKMNTYLVSTQSSANSSHGLGVPSQPLGLSVHGQWRSCRVPVWKEYTNTLSTLKFSAQSLTMYLVQNAPPNEVHSARRIRKSTSVTLLGRAWDKPSSSVLKALSVLLLSALSYNVYLNLIEVR